MANIAVLFPGQGSQKVGMGRDVAEASRAARDIYNRANQIVGYDLASLCFEGPADQLEKTDIQQPAIFVTSVAIWQAYQQAGGANIPFSHAAGLSLGEYTALYAAGAVSFEDALPLVQRRGQLMQEAAEARPSGMVSLIGAEEETAVALCRKAKADDILAPANFNCPGQIVLSGNKSACDRAVELAEEFGCRAVSLAVAGAFHSPLMDSAARGLVPVLGQTPFAKPQWAVSANVNAEYHGGSADGIRERLAKQVTQPVLWQRCVERMIADGVDHFVEIGPGRVLAGLMRKINRQVKVSNISTAAAIQSAVEATATGT